MKSDHFSVPSHSALIQPGELPISSRLENAFQQLGIRYLGELNGVAYTTLLRIRNCGRKTVAELERLLESVERGVYRVEERTCERRPGELFALLDAAVDALPPRQRNVALLRYGGANEPLPFRDIGKQMNLTHQRAMQILQALVQQVLKLGGPPLSSALRAWRERCIEKVCPVTAGLLERDASKAALPAKRCISFYMRLLADLDRELPVWRESRGRYRQRDRYCLGLDLAIRKLIRQQRNVFTFADLFRKLKQEPEFRRIDEREFLHTVMCSPVLVADFADPERPRIRLARLSTTDLVQLVMQTTQKPLTTAEIRKRIAQLEISGGNAPNRQSILKALCQKHGVYRLDRSAFGLRQHFKLPRELWDAIRSDFHSALAKRNRPCSTLEFIRQSPERWGRLTNPYELVHVLREDTRFADLGKGLFALAEWNIRKRELIRELIPKVLLQAGRPMTASEIRRELYKLRSISPVSITAPFVRKHPQVCEVGQNRFALKDPLPRADAAPGAL